MQGKGEEQEKTSVRGNASGGEVEESERGWTILRGPLAVQT